MGRKKRKFESNIHPADKWMERMKLKDLKRECVVRGMEFSNIITLSIPDMAGWFRKNYYNKTEHDLLDIFDDWQEKQIIESLEKRGEDPKNLIHPSLRLGYIAEKDEKGNVTKRKRAKVIIAKKKEKRERTIDGLFAGTKKAYTFTLQMEGKTKAETIELVLKKFPDASEKSIGIWFNKSKKLHVKMV